MLWMSARLYNKRQPNRLYYTPISYYPCPHPPSHPLSYSLPYSRSYWFRWLWPCAIPYGFKVWSRRKVQPLPHRLCCCPNRTTQKHSPPTSHLTPLSVGHSKLISFSCDRQFTLTINWFPRAASRRQLSGGYYFFYTSCSSHTVSFMLRLHCHITSHHIILNAIGYYHLHQN